MAKLADALDLGSSGVTHVGSIPIIRTEKTEIVVSHRKDGHSSKWPFLIEFLGFLKKTGTNLPFSKGSKSLLKRGWQGRFRPAGFMNTIKATARHQIYTTVRISRHERYVALQMLGWLPPMQKNLCTATLNMTDDGVAGGVDHEAAGSPIAIIT